MDRSPHLFATDSYEDITEQLRAAAKAMEQGSVALAPGMRMHDALPAFQIGSEKVDTGSPNNFKTLASEIEAARSKFPIDSNESNLCAFADALSRAEMAWQAGYSPVQTVLSCLAVEDMLNQLQKDPNYVTDLLELAEKDESTHGFGFIANVYVLSVILTVGVAVEQANQSTVIYPEEDLHTTRPWLHLVERIGGVQLVTEKLEKCYKLASSLGYAELVKRINLRQTWINILKQRIPKKTVHLDKMLVSLDEVFPKESSAKDSAEPSAWFSSGCQVRLDMECLRLDTVFYSTEQAREMWLEIVEGIRRCVPVYNVQRSVDLLGFFLQFSLRQEPAIVRAMLKIMVQPGQFLGQSLKQWVIKDVSETSPPFDHSVLKTKPVERFLGQAGLCYVDILTTFCMNRCRIREGLSALIIAFDSLQVAASSVGDADTATTLASWVYFRKLQVMLWVVLLGFETKVVSYREQGYANWYAFRLSNHLLAHLGRMRRAFELHGNNARESPGYGFLMALELESQTLSQLLTAEYMLYIALHKGVSPPSPIAANGPSEEMLYGLRFQMFQTIGVPTLPTLAEYKVEYEALDVETALRGSANASKSVRGLLATLGPLAAENPEIPKLKKSALGLAVAVSCIIRGQVYTGLDTDGYHAYFPVPKIAQPAEK